MKNININTCYYVKNCKVKTVELYMYQTEIICSDIIQHYSVSGYVRSFMATFCEVVFLCPILHHLKNGGGALNVTPAHPLSKFGVRSITWKTASIQFKFGMLIYKIKTQVKFDLGYNPLVFDYLWAFYKNIVNAFSGGIRVLWTHF